MDKLYKISFKKQTFDNNIKKIITNYKNNNKDILEGRLIFFDFLRIISSFSIIILHVSAKLFYKLNINSYNWKISFYINGLSRFAVPNFFMISGALFLNKDISFKNMYRKYIKRLFIVLYFWSLIYSISDIYFTKKGFKMIIIKCLFPHFHLWYLITTIGLYTITPFLREIVKNEKILNYYLLFSLIYTFIFPNLIHFLSFYSNILFYALNSFYIKLSLNYIKGYTFYFIFGFYLLKKFKGNNYKRILFYCFGLFGILFTTKFAHKILILKKKKSLIYFSHFQLNILFYSSSIFVFFKENFNHFKLANIQRVSKLTFGIYLIHPLIIKSIFQTKKIFSENFSPYDIPFISLIIFLLSLIISFLIKLVPLFGKYLI